VPPKSTLVIMYPWSIKWELAAKLKHSAEIYIPFATCQTTIHDILGPRCGYEYRKPSAKLVAMVVVLVLVDHFDEGGPLMDYDAPCVVYLGMAHNVVVFEVL
jgi:hypothetical protein